MVSQTLISVAAVYDGGVLRPEEPLPLRINDRVMIQFRIPDREPIWPADVAEIYDELAAEDQALAEQHWANVSQTWPTEPPK